MTKTSTDKKRYAAKLLFQFRVGVSDKMRICEERIILLQTCSAKEALRQAKQRGRQSQSQYRNDEGERVRFEFVGVMDLLHLGIECEEDEAWFDIRSRLMPMEKKEKLIPKEADLNAIFWERESERKKRK
jgi:hypothetical protein